MQIHTTRACTKKKWLNYFSCTNKSVLEGKWNCNIFFCSTIWYWNCKITRSMSLRFSIDSRLWLIVSSLLKTTKINLSRYESIWYIFLLFHFDYLRVTIKFIVGRVHGISCKGWTFFGSVYLQFMPWFKLLWTLSLWPFKNGFWGLIHSSNNSKLYSCMG